MQPNGEADLQAALRDPVLRPALDDTLDRLLQLRAREAAFRLLAERGSTHAAAEAARHKLVRASLGDHRAITWRDVDERSAEIGSVVPSPDARLGSWDEALADETLLPALVMAAEHLRRLCDGQSAAGRWVVGLLGGTVADPASDGAA
jgi:hypothetical protein